MLVFQGFFGIIKIFINKNVIEELRETYEKELSEGTSSLPDALSQISAKTGKKFILILDEWDVLIRDEAANQKIQDEYQTADS